MKAEFNWESFVNKFHVGQELFISPNWRDDKFRAQIRRLSKKGYFKKLPRFRNGVKYGFGDWFERTDKAYIKGDSPKKSLSFSKS